jgi:hypothetical protein
MHFKLKQNMFGSEGTYRVVCKPTYDCLWPKGELLYYEWYKQEHKKYLRAQVYARIHTF